MAVRLVNLSPTEAYEKLVAGLSKRFSSLEEITSHMTRLPGGGESIVGVFENIPTVTATA